MQLHARLFLRSAILLALVAGTACGDDDDEQGDAAPTNQPLYAECGSVAECAIGEEEGGLCQTTPSTPDTAICTVDCLTTAYDIPEPEVGGCYTSSPADKCGDGCCLIEAVEVINDFGDMEGTGICVPQAP